MALDQGNSFCLLNAFHLEEVMSLNIQTSCLEAPFWFLEFWDLRSWCGAWTNHFHSVPWTPEQKSQGVKGCYLNWVMCPTISGACNHQTGFPKLLLYSCGGLGNLATASNSPLLCSVLFTATVVSLRMLQIFIFLLLLAFLWWSAWYSHPREAVVQSPFHILLILHYRRLLHFAKLFAQHFDVLLDCAPLGNRKS